MSTDRAPLRLAGIGIATYSPSMQSGFTLIEAAVALLIAATMVAAVGLASQNSLHQRATTEANGAAMHIAVQKMELLLSLLDATGDPDLTAGTHGPVVVDEQGTGAAAGAYSVSWQVVDAFPAAGAKKITITVTHTKANDVRAQLVTYYKY